MATQARSSSSFTTYAWTYDVFLNFRGQDTRTGFTGNLYNALRQKGIHTFIDDEDLQKGEEITPSLLKAIQDSRIAITIFSKNYASSTFCLEELVKILECIKQHSRLVWPIFYDVDPSDVRHLKNSYEDALTKHEARIMDKEKVQKWKKALHEASNLSGWHFDHKSDKYEYKFIKSIVKEVSRKINRIPLHIANYPVGLESPVRKVISLLDVRSDEGVNMVGIYGIPGMGKTTIASAVYNLIADQFEGVCFLADIRFNAFKYGLAHLQETLLSELIGDKHIKLQGVNQGIPILKSRLCQKKILLVLDNIDKLEQLHAVAGGLDWFGSGSRIIITTRNKHLLDAHGVNRTYEAELMSHEESVELFKWAAFKSDKADPKYVDILSRVVRYCNGLPLALEIIGSNLFGKSIDEWNSALDTYTRIPDKNVQGILEASYDGLDENEKEIFLDMTCFFKGSCLGDVTNILLNVRGFRPEYSIGVLIEKSLIKVERGVVTMHDLLEDMGKEIVRQQSPLEPGKRSRLWFYEDILHVLEEDTGTEEIEAIMLSLPKDKEVQWDGNAFKKMKNLKILSIKNANFSTGPQHLPNNLRFLDWPQYPSLSLPNDFHSDKLVTLNLSRSCLVFIEPFKNFKSLSEINLYNCICLERMPDISEVPNLKKLNLSYCRNLIEVHDSVGFLDKLRWLNVKNCPKLRIFPSLIKSRSLEDLDLSDCPNLNCFPETLGIMENISHVWLTRDSNVLALRERISHTLICSPLMLPKIAKLIKKFRSLSNWKGQDQERGCSSMVFSNVRYMTCDVWSLPHKSLSTLLGSLPNLEELNFSHTGLTNNHLPTGHPWPPNLVILDLTATSITFLPESIKECRFLTEIFLDDCNQLQEIRGVPPNIEILSATYCTSLTAQSASILLTQTVHEAGFTRFTLPGARIPRWFDHYTREGSLAFWFRRTFPKIALCLVSDKSTMIHLLVNGITCCKYPLKEFCFFEYPFEEYKWIPHISLFDLQGTYDCVNDIDKFIYTEDAWILAEVLLEGSYCDSAEWIGVYVYKQENSRDDVTFMNPYSPKRKFDDFCKSNNQDFIDLT